LIGVILFSCAVGAEPSGSGIAARYPGDEGIENDPSVIYVDQFEDATVADVLSRYEDWIGDENISMSTVVPVESAGSRSICFDGGAQIYRRIATGHDQLFFRFYIRFRADSDAVHHTGLWVGGYNPSLPYFYPRAGTRPAGNDFWSTSIEPINWYWEYYTYWQGMHPGLYGNWGNTFFGWDNGPMRVERGNWICVELMVRMNRPVSSANGEQAFWIDGRLVSHMGPGYPDGTWDFDVFDPDIPGGTFEGFQWRTDDNLSIDHLCLINYLDNPDDASVWFDHLVVATEYIGPISAD